MVQTSTHELSSSVVTQYDTLHTSFDRQQDVLRRCKGLNTIVSRAPCHADREPTS